ncbi:hypothetical protein SLS54_009860 [Diplodia seriata]
MLVMRIPSGVSAGPLEANTRTVLAKSAVAAEQRYDPVSIIAHGIDAERQQCNGQKPSCSRCLNHQLTCVFTADADHRGSAPRAYVRLLQDRLTLLEQVLELHAIDLEASVVQLSARTSERKEVLTAASETPSLAVNETCTDAEGSLSNRSGGGNEAHFFGPTSGRLELQSPEDASPAPGNVLGQNDGNGPNSTIEHQSQQRFNTHSEVLMSSTLRDLSPELVEHLIDLYFEWEEPWYQVVDEALFRDSRQSNGRHFSPLLLYCILAVASRYSDRPEVRSDPQDPNTAGIIFLEHAEALLHFDLKWPSVTTIQSLAIMAVLYVDCQGSVALPVNVLSDTNPMEIAALNDPRSVFLASLLRELSTQCQILEKILTTLYFPKRTTLDAEKRSFFDSCLLALRGWSFSLPKELKVRLSDRPEQANASPHAYILNMVYHTSFVLLARPFLPRRWDSSHGLDEKDSSYDDLGQRASSLCREAAKNICHLGERYRETFGSFRRSPVTATHCTLMAALVTIFLGHSQEFDGTKEKSRDLRSYMSTLRELSDSWTPPRQYWRTLTRVLRDRSKLDRRRNLQGKETWTTAENEADNTRFRASQQEGPDDASTCSQLKDGNMLAEEDAWATKVDANHGNNTVRPPSLPALDQLDFSFLDEIPLDCIDYEALGLDLQWIG